MRKLFLLVSVMLITGAFLQAQVNVTFQADMRVQIATGYFDPATEVITCPGGFNKNNRRLNLTLNIYAQLKYILYSYIAVQGRKPLSR